MTKVRNILAVAITLGTLGFSTQASAVSFAVKIACASDYYSYCSQHAPGTKATRQCMRANGSKLSKRCVNALVSAGLVSSKYVMKKKAMLGK